MDSLLLGKTVPKPAFSDFGGTEFAAVRVPLETLPVEGEPKDMCRHIRERCPREAGVYGMVDLERQLVYVGMSGRLRDRLLTYWTKGPPRAKEQRIAARTRQLVWEVVGHEFTARLRELELIRRWRPAYNVRGRPERKEIGYVFVSAGAAPRFRAGRLLPRASRMVWGPTQLTRRLRAAIDRLNHFFRLRDCPNGTPIHFSEQRSLFDGRHQVQCMRGTLRTCLAPCAGGCTGHEYTQQILAARGLLDGTDTSIVDGLETAMRETAARQEFEKAAAYRDALEDLTFLTEQFQVIQRVRREFWFVYPVQCHTGVVLWALIAGGRITKVIRAPHCKTSARTCLRLLEQNYGDWEPEDWSEDFDHMHLAASWFRKFPSERRKVLCPDEAKAICSRFCQKD